jgi:hypothetical protein
MLVRRRDAASGGGAQVVVLDHGLYIELSDDVRINLCRSNHLFSV